jgi:hypothetical protein
MNQSALTEEVGVEVPAPFMDLFEPKRYKAFFGGRGSGKSHSFAKALISEAYNADMMHKPIRVLCAREIQRSIKDSVKLLLDDQIKLLGLEHHFTSLQNEIRGEGGSTFLFAGLGQLTTDQIKSMEGIDRCWIEESQTISQRSLEVLIPTIRKPGSELWFSWNPRNASDPVDELFRGTVVPLNAVIKKVNYDCNSFFPQELNAERVFDKEKKRDRYAHIWLGEYEPTAIGAIWDRQTFHQNRREEIPELNRIVVSVDPAISSEDHSNEHGIIVAGIDDNQRGYVLDDLSKRGTPREWANRAVSAFDKWEADAIVIEINQGGDMVRHTLESVRPGLPIVEVRATRGKHIRAEPISALYGLGRISHVGTFTELEDQMVKMTAGGFEGEGSPDRVDALVWGFTHLFPKMVQRPSKPRKRFVPHSSAGWMG